MGLLDDAIREHLDLKRRHGASEEELARKEAEALGPARRDFPRAVAAEPAAEEEAAHDEPGLEEPAFDEPLAEEPLAEEPLAEEPPEYEPPRERMPEAPQPADQQPPTEEYFIEDDEEPEPHGDEPFLEELKPPPAEPEQAARQGEEDEDVLEDTPEFLQETPEHDRLWFEQKPPRDFDFD